MSKGKELSNSLSNRRVSLRKHSFVRENVLDGSVQEPPEGCGVQTAVAVPVSHTFISNHVYRKRSLSAQPTLSAETNGVVVLLTGAVIFTLADPAHYSIISFVAALA